MSERRTIGDMKAGLTGKGGARPALSILPRAGLTHATRGTEYGAAYYARGNYHGPVPQALVDKWGPDLAPVIRVLGYIDATMRHLTKVADVINHALGTGGDARAAVAVVDDVAVGKPASNLPDLAHAAASLLILIGVAVDDGLLPADPGQPWATGGEDGLPQKDDPAAERRQTERRRLAASATMKDIPSLLGAQFPGDDIPDPVKEPDALDAITSRYDGVKW